MIVIDRRNALAPGWSHVVSTTNDVAELDAFRRRVGAPVAALQLANPRWPHLDLRDGPRDRALACPDIVIVPRTADLVRYVRMARLTSRP